VLLEGETGTGKEVIARAQFVQCPRDDLFTGSGFPLKQHRGGTRRNHQDQPADPAHGTAAADQVR